MHAETSLFMEHDMRSTPHARMQQKCRYSSREHHYITPGEGAAHCCARCSARTRGTSMTFTTGPPNGTVTAGRRRRLSGAAWRFRRGNDLRHQQLAGSIARLDISHHGRQSGRLQVGVRRCRTHRRGQRDGCCKYKKRRQKQRCRRWHSGGGPAVSGGHLLADVGGD